MNLGSRWRRCTLNQKIIYSIMVVSLAALVTLITLLGMIEWQLHGHVIDLSIELICLAVMVVFSYPIAWLVGKRISQPAHDVFDRLIEEMTWQYEGLIKAKTLAETGNRMKSEFLANMSHELRTPLNSLLILAHEFIENEDGNLSADQVEDATIMYNSGKDLLGLINDILDLSKIEAGKMDLSLNNIKLLDITENLEKTFRPVATKQNLSFEIFIDMGVAPMLYTDKTRVEQILKNFLSNAFKFTGSGGIQVKIFHPDTGALPSHLAQEAKRTLAISVTDTGIGMTADELAVIFEAFRQADGSVSRKYGGTGLGLSICEKLAKALGGSIRAESEKGRGSRFTLYLPVTLEQTREVTEDTEDTEENDGASMQPETDLSASMPQQNEPTNDDRHNITPEDNVILVVDDDTAFARILRKKIHEAGCKCLIANNGIKGLQLAKEYAPKAIILDIELTGISGIDIHKQLNSNPKTRNIPILFMTVHDNIPSFAAAESIGFLTKPVTAKQLEYAFSAIATSLQGSINHLLIVEDDDALRKTLQSITKKFRMEVDVAATAQEALHILEAITPDTMLLDLMLPDMDGLDLLEKIATNPKVTKPRVIVYSGKDLSDADRKRIEQYADSYIQKSGKRTEEVLASLQELSLKKAATTAVTAPMTATASGTPMAAPSSQAQPDGTSKPSSIIEEEEQETTAASGKSTHLLSARKVLIVDDDSRNIFVLSRLLSKTGANIHTAQNGQQAIDFLKNNMDTVMVFMDVMMPVMDGLTAIKELRKIDDFKQLPIISVTAKAMREDEIICLDAGATAYLSKPVDKKLLFDTIERTIADE